ncbi:MAG: methyltransferase [Deltaproteobacteria bacterium]|nr:methyltransferase [Deltaproteobacteria bacterium]
MAEMSGYERVMRTFGREPVDTMPFFSGMGMVLQPAIKKLGYKFPQVHTSAEKLARSGIESARMFNLDSVVIPYDMCWESEALGNKISLYEDSEDILYPTIPNKNWTELDQVNITDNDIETIMSRGRMQLIPEAIKIVKKEAPEKALGAWQLGPFTQMGQTIELDKVLKAVFKQKAKVEAILDRFTEMIIEIGKSLQAAGADFITLREPGVAADLISPKTFKEIIKPRLTRILDAWKSPKVLHICGSTDSLIEMMHDCGADALSVDIKNNLIESRKKLGDNVLLFGNFDVFALPCKAETTVEQAVAGMKTNIDGGVDAVWPGCDLWPDIKEENFRAMEQTVREYGRKASPALGRTDGGSLKK